MAKRMGGKVIEIEASRLALISHPDAITKLIIGARRLRMRDPGRERPRDAEFPVAERS